MGSFRKAKSKRERTIGSIKSAFGGGQKKKKEEKKKEEEEAPSMSLGQRLSESLKKRKAQRRKRARGN